MLMSTCRLQQWQQLRLDVQCGLLVPNQLDAITSNTAQGPTPASLQSCSMYHMLAAPMLLFILCPPMISPKITALHLFLYFVLS